MSRPSLRDLYTGERPYRMHRWDHYIPIYERHFGRFRDRPIEQFAYLQHLWNEKWQQQGHTPPGLFALVDGVTVDKLEYDGFGLFVIRVPDDMKTEHAVRIARVWDASWSR